MCLTAISWITFISMTKLNIAWMFNNN
jgi:hypothetical protein